MPAPAPTLTNSPRAWSLQRPGALPKTCLILLTLTTLALGCNNTSQTDDSFEAARDRQVAPPPVELTPAQETILTAGDPLAPPDARRQAVINIALSNVGGEPLYVDFYRAIIQHAETDATVAAACAAALALHGEPDDTTYITPLLRSNDPFTRWQAAVTLQRLHNPAVIPALINMLGTDKDSDARMAAADALAQYPRRDVFTALTQSLNDSDYGVTRASHHALQLITGQTLPDDPRDWLQLADDNPQTLFDNAQPYTYQKYLGPPNLFGLGIFWLDRDQNSNTPKGYTPPV